MAAVNTDLVLRHVRRLLAARRVEPLPDLQLLQRFTVSHHEQAFTALVERHGPMVSGIGFPSASAFRHFPEKS
jgi:hypothetical protein